MASFFKSTRRVEFCETDMAGIVHFSNFYKWMEQCEHEVLSFAGAVDCGASVGWFDDRLASRFVPVPF